MSQIWTDWISQSPPNIQSLLLVFAIILAFWYLSLIAKKNDSSSIPGPFRLPPFGSIFVFSRFISVEGRHDFRVDLAKKYGEIYAVVVGKINLVFLNSPEVIKEAFVTKGWLMG